MAYVKTPSYIPAYRISNNVDSGSDTMRGSWMTASSVRVTRMPKGA